MIKGIMKTKEQAQDLLDKINSSDLTKVKLHLLEKNAVPQWKVWLQEYITKGVIPDGGHNPVRLWINEASYSPISAFYDKHDQQDLVYAQHYELKDERGQWLGDVVLTTNGMYSSVTDWGNFSYKWNSIGKQTFKEFLLGLSEEYFATKIYTGMTYIEASKGIEGACKRYAQHIFPALQKALRQELERGQKF